MCEECEHPIRFFISYSSDDRAEAQTLASRLTERGVDVWIDYEQIRPGDPILQKISEGLDSARALLLLVSDASGASPWCRKEYEPLLKREFVSGTTIVVPIRLDDSPVPVLLEDKRYLNLSEIDGWIDELVGWASSGVVAPASQATKQVGKYYVRPEVLEGLTILLLIDQFPIGVWGRSLTGLEAAYGHAGDPGSITVSSWCADALRDLQPNGTIPEIQAFTQYLLERRRDDTGAVGMRKQIGSGFAKEYAIIENRRHTAVAALYLHRHASALDLSLQSLRYVMESQTARGAWAAVDKPTDENADPLTTGYVLGVLRRFERENLLSAVAIKDQDLFLARYWKAGLLWLYENLISHDGWWPYRDATRTYCYTSDVLLAIPEFWMEDTDYERAHESLVTRLFDVWRENGVGIPSGPGSDLPCLEATAQYAAALWKCRTRYPQLSEKAQELFLSNLETILADGESDAAGWSLTISHLIQNLGAKLAGKDALPRLRELATNVEQGGDGDGGRSVLYAAMPSWVGAIATMKILNVTVNPP